MKDVLKNEDLYLDNIMDYQNKDLYHVNDANTVGIMSISKDSIRKYFVYFNNEQGLVEFSDETFDFELGIMQAKDIYERLFCNIEFDSNNIGRRK